LSTTKKIRRLANIPFGGLHHVPSLSLTLQLFQNNRTTGRNAEEGKEGRQVHGPLD
jgi:hypothetical protein